MILDEEVMEAMIKINEKITKQLKASNQAKKQLRDSHGRFRSSFNKDIYETLKEIENIGFKDSSLNGRLDRIEKRLDKIEKRLDSLIISVTTTTYPPYTTVCGGFDYTKSK